MPRLLSCIAALLLAVPCVALAHGGHDAPAPTKRATAAEERRAPVAADGEGRIYLAKEVQFLLGVRTAVVEARPLQSRLTVPGTVAPRTDLHAQVFSPVTGRLLPPRSGKLPLLGSRVEKGQVLAIVQQSLPASDAAQLSSGRIRAEAELDSATARLEQARRELARREGLRGVVAEKEIQEAALAVKVAEQEVERARRERGLFGGEQRTGAAGVARFELVAPIGGVLAEAEATAGELVDASRPLFTVLDPSTVWIEARVFAEDVARVESAREAVIRVEAYPDLDLHAPLVHLGQLVDPQTRTVRALFEAKNPDGKLRPGMFVQVAIGFGEARPTLAIPETALVEEDGAYEVFVQVSPEEFVPRPVKPGLCDEGYCAVLSGLRGGEKVVTTGTYQLHAAEH